MKSALLAAALVGSASAFAPGSVAKTSTALNAFESELGVQPPLGFWDPLGILDGADQEKFDRLRYVEIQHWDGAIDKAGDQYSSFGNGLGALFGPNAIPGPGLFQIIAFIGLLEVSFCTDWTESAEFPGDLRNGTFGGGWNNYTDKQKLQKRGVELNI